MSRSSNQSKVMVVAVEYGGQWCSNVRPEEGIDLVMVVQLVGEEPLEFARRTMQKLVNLLEGGAELVSAAFVVASAVDTRHLEARCLIARTLMRTLRSANSPLHLVAPRDATADCRSHLTAIAEGLLENAAPGSQIRISDDRRCSSTAATARLDR
jgi:hypothetical protein